MGFISGIHLKMLLMHHYTIRKLKNDGIKQRKPKINGIVIFFKEVFLHLEMIIDEKTLIDESILFHLIKYTPLIHYKVF